MDNKINYKIIKINTEDAKKIETRLQNNNGFCPCALIKDKTTKCVCEDFRNKINDKTFFGLCHCGLYKKEKIGI